MATEDFDSKRPDHPDFMVPSELKGSEFSGIRMNSISGEGEVWVAGELRKVIRKEFMQVDKNAAIANAMEDIFLLGDVQIDEG